ncbi:MAG TPA: PPC domain-containing DNA-binding protein [Marmoricola sp.]|nr:PPC domain-containing DNA-binding protein [Marmoricola sp.]
MKYKQVSQVDGLRTFVIVLDKGDEAFEQVSAFVREQGITAAGITGVGAGNEVTLGYFDPEIMDYRATDFAEQLELLSMVGDVAAKDGEPTVHAHIVLGRKDSTTIGGHLQRFVVWPTLELVLTESPATLRKKVDPETGLALIDLDASA